MTDLSFGEITQQWVKDWVDTNIDEFGENRCYIREHIFERCKQYDEAPISYLETRLSNLPDAMRWYLGVFQNIF